MQLLNLDPIIAQRSETTSLSFMEHLIIEMQVWSKQRKQATPYLVNDTGVTIGTSYEMVKINTINLMKTMTFS